MWEFKKDIICPQDTKSLARYKAYCKYYKVKYDIARKLAPLTILEIGVRAGYSAYAFLSACPRARYRGIDAENGKYGGENGPWMWWAKKILAGFDTWFSVVDSQTLTKLDASYDFIHIDGDHSKLGSIHDLELCWPALNAGGAILIDDYDYLDPVREGVDEFVAKYRIKKQYIKSLRGEILLRAKK